MNTALVIVVIVEAGLPESLDLLCDLADGLVDQAAGPHLVQVVRAEAAAAQAEVAFRDREGGQYARMTLVVV